MLYTRDSKGVMRKTSYDKNGNLVYSSSDSIDGQMSLAIDGELNIKEEKNEIIDLSEDSDISTEELALKDNVLELLKPGKFDIRNFMDQFENKSELALARLLSLQSNDDPLKKGGSGIGFRCDAIILANKQTFDSKENTLFDVISGYVSSHPDDASYIIYAKDVKDRLPYASSSYIYTLMREAAESLSNKPLLYDIEMPDGSKERVKVPWYSLLTYNKKKDGVVDDSSYVAFKPTPLFKMLMLAATITHGAYYSIEAVSKIKSSYAKTLYYILESRKDYRAYPNATPGLFTFKFDELHALIGYPSNYTASEIKRSILEPAYKQINELGDEIDFSFTYNMIKTSNGGAKKKYTAVEFHVQKSIAGTIVEKEKEPTVVETNNTDDIAVMAILTGQGLSQEECRDVLKKYHANGRDLVFLSQAITFASAKNVRNKTAVLCHMMDNGLNSFDNKSDSKTNKFVNFEQRDYDDLESTLLNTSVPEN